MHLHRRLTGFLAVIVVLVGAVVLLISNPSTAEDEPDRLTGQEAEQTSEQSPADESDSGALPNDVSPEQHRAQLAVDAFLQPLIEEMGLDLWASVDWKNSRIVLKGSPAVMEKLRSHEGESVGGLLVSVSEAVVTRHEYEKAIVRLNEVGNELPIEIDSYSLPAASDRVEIHVRGLAGLSTESLADARSQIHRLVEMPIRLVEASPERWIDRGDSSSPWLGGVQMRHNVGTAGVACSSAFSVVKNRSASSMGWRCRNWLPPVGGPLRWDQQPATVVVARLGQQ